MGGRAFRLAIRGELKEDHQVPDGLIVSAIASAVAGHVSIDDAMKTVAEVLSDEVGGQLSVREQDALIKAAVVLKRPIDDSIAKLGDFELRLRVRYGDDARRRGCARPPRR